VGNVRRCHAMLAALKKRSREEVRNVYRRLACSGPLNAAKSCTPFISISRSCEVLSNDFDHAKYDDELRAEGSLDGLEDECKGVCWTESAFALNNQNEVQATHKVTSGQKQNGSSVIVEVAQRLKLTKKQVKDAAVEKRSSVAGVYWLNTSSRPNCWVASHRDSGKSKYNYFPSRNKKGAEGMDAVALAFCKAVLKRRDAIAQGAPPQGPKKCEITGVSWNEKKHTWIAQFMLNGKNHQRVFTPKDASSKEKEHARQRAIMARNELVAKYQGQVQPKMAQNGRPGQTRKRKAESSQTYHATIL